MADPEYRRIGQRSTPNTSSTVWTVQNSLDSLCGWEPGDQVAMVIMGYRTIALGGGVQSPPTITCDVDNKASIRVIEKNGGILDAVVPSRMRGQMICQYWVET